MTIIQQLREENARLREEKAQTEKDMAFVANTAKSTWDGLGFDFSSMERANGEKASMGDIAKIAIAVGRKMMSGKIKIQAIVEDWDRVQPVLKKYEHVMNDTKKLD